METENKLPKEFKEKWIAALRSGEYRKACGALHRTESYDILGVACKIAGYSDDVLIHDIIPRDFENVPEILRGAAWSNKVVERLTYMNDEDFKTFPEIADWIEENL